MKVKVKERVNWPITILLILGLVTVIFPLYLTVVIAFKKPSEMTNSISPESYHCQKAGAFLTLQKQCV